MDYWKPAIDAVVTDKAYVLKEFLDSDAANVINYKYRGNKSLLHMACYYGSIECAKLLIAAGADVNERRKLFNHKTPLYEVFWNSDSTELVELLIANGAPINVVDDDNRTPLHDACWHGAFNCAKLLIKLGIKVNVLDKDRNSPLHYAAISGSVECMRLLISTGKIDLNTPDAETDKTPLHYVCQRGSIGCADVLIAAGADVNVQDRNGKFPQDLTISPKIIELIASVNGGKATKPARS